MNPFFSVLHQAVCSFSVTFVCILQSLYCRCVVVLSLQQWAYCAQLQNITSVSFNPSGDLHCSPRFCSLQFYTRPSKSGRTLSDRKKNVMCSVQINVTSVPFELSRPMGICYTRELEMSLRKWTTWFFTYNIYRCGVWCNQTMGGEVIDCSGEVIDCSGDITGNLLYKLLVATGHNTQHVTHISPCINMGSVY